MPLTQRELKPRPPWAANPFELLLLEPSAPFVPPAPPLGPPPGDPAVPPALASPPPPPPPPAANTSAEHGEPRGSAYTKVPPPPEGPLLILSTELVPLPPMNMCSVWPAHR